MKCNAEDDEIILVKIITIIIIMMIIIMMIMMMTTMMITMISIMVIIGQECPLPAGGQMGSVWKWRLLMNTGTAATGRGTQAHSDTGTAATLWSYNARNA